MRNIISKRLLVSVVLLIWVVVTLRFLDGCSTTTTNPVKESQNLLTFHSSAVPDSFTLSLQYADPFLRNAKSPRFKRLSLSNEANTPVKKNFTTPLPQLPQIQFLGGIKGKDEQKMIGVIMLEGKSFSVKSGDRVKDVLIKDIQFEALTIAFNDSIYQITI